MTPSIDDLPDWAQDIIENLRGEVANRDLVIMKLSIVFETGVDTRMIPIAVSLLKGDTKAELTASATQVIEVLESLHDSQLRDRRSGYVGM